MSGAGSGACWTWGRNRFMSRAIERTYQLWWRLGPAPSKDPTLFNLVRRIRPRKLRAISEHYRNYRHQPLSGCRIQDCCRFFSHSASHQTDSAFKSNNCYQYPERLHNTALTSSRDDPGRESAALYGDNLILVDSCLFLLAVGWG